MHLDMLISGNPLCAGMLEELQEHVESIDMANGMSLGLYHINVNQPVNLFLLHHSLNDPFLDGDMSITLFGRRKFILIDSLIFYLSSSTFCELLLLLEKQDYRRGRCCVRCLANIMSICLEDLRSVGCLGLEFRIKKQN